eukprot:scaffold454595_cov14-Prasinocladus_malaysianus.AAC.1
MGMVCLATNSAPVKKPSAPCSVAMNLIKAIRVVGSGRYVISRDGLALAYPIRAIFSSPRSAR